MASESLPLSPKLGNATRDVVAQTLGRAANAIISFATSLILIRALGQHQFGQWATIVAITTTLGWLGELGLEAVAVRRAVAEPGMEPRILGALVSLRSFLAVPTTALCVVVGVIVARGAEMRAAMLILSLVLLAAAPSVLRCAFQIRLKNYVIVAVATVNAVAWAAVVVGVTRAGGGLIELATGYVAATALTTAVYVFGALRVAAVDFRKVWSLWPEFTRVGLPLGLATFLVLTYANFDQVLVFRLAGSRDAGLYGAVSRILYAAQFVPLSLMATVFPLLAAAYPGNPARARRLLQLSTEYLSLVSAPALALTLAAAAPLVEALFGPAFADSAPALPILMAAYVLLCYNLVLGYLLIVLGRQRRFLLNAAVALGFNVGLNWVFVPAYGFIAAAVITALTEALVLVLAGVVTFQTLGTKPVVRKIARTFGAAGVMAGVVAGLRVVGLPLVVQASAGLLVYMGGLIAFRAVSAAEVRSVAARVGD